MTRAARALTSLLTIAGLVCALLPSPLVATEAPPETSPRPLTHADGGWQGADGPSVPLAIIAGTRTDRGGTVSRSDMGGVVPLPASWTAPRQTRQRGTTRDTTPASLDADARAPRGPPPSLLPRA